MRHTLPAPPPPASLEAALAQVASCVPGLAATLHATGSAAPRPGIRPHADNAEAIAALREYWRERHPEAGPHYLAIRCWGLLIWQPLYVAVLALHRAGSLPEVARMTMPVRDGYLCGYAIEEHVAPAAPTDEAAAIALAAGPLRAVCDHFRGEVQARLRLSARAAACLQADCLLYALLAAREADDPLRDGRAATRAGLWLEHLGLRGRSGYQPMPVAGGSVLAIERQVCCHTYRCQGGSFCAICPKLDAAERASRLAREQAAA